MKIELHTCDRCGDDVRVPEQSIYHITIDKELGEQEVCDACHEAILANYYGRHINSLMKGVIEHEDKYRRSVEETAEEASK